MTSPRPDAGTVERGRAYLQALLPAEFDAYMDALAQFAAPLEDVLSGKRMADPNDRLQAVRFTLALHGLEAAILAGALDAEAVDNAAYMRYAQLEEALETALPPRPGFTGRPHPPAPAGPGGADPGGDPAGGPLMPS